MSAIEDPRMSLRQRAEFALADRHAETKDHLQSVARVLARDILDSTVAAFGAVDTNLNTIDFEVDRFKFRAKATIKAVKQGTSDRPGLELQEEILTLQMYDGVSVWQPVTDLADVGEMIQKHEKLQADE